MNSGSFFLAEIAQTTSSVRPGGSASASMSLTKPHLHSRLARASSAFAVVLMSVLFPRDGGPLRLGGERRAATAARLGVGIDEREPAREPLLHVVEHRLVQVEVALLVADHSHSIGSGIPGLRDRARCRTRARTTFPEQPPPFTPIRRKTSSPRLWACFNSFTCFTAAFDTFSAMILSSLSRHRERRRHAVASEF